MEETDPLQENDEKLLEKKTGVNGALPDISGVGAQVEVQVVVD